MPIRINLLAEAQAAEEMRRKDPVKRSIWIASFIVAVALIGSLTLQLKIITVRSNVKTLASGWSSIEAKVKEVDKQRRETRDLESKLAALDQFTTNRMLWAVVLNALQGAAVDNIQVVRLKSEQNYTLNEPAKKPGTAASKPATVTEQITLSLEGRDFSPRQADQVPHFKDALVKAPFLAENLQSSNKVQLTSMTAPQLDGARAFVGFALQVHFQEKERRLYE
jgi:hypothetical protein